MTKKSTIITINEICGIFKAYCEENSLKFSKEKFDVFLKFLEIDFYDWVKENLTQFYNQK